MPIKDQQNLVRRPPVIVVMGHIDHGKSTLLDYVRKSNVVAGEAGGITQHVGAYQAEHITKSGTKTFMTFLDTPGHEAFCSIRERGAHAADIAILVVSAEDGVKPQTLEAYRDIMHEKIPYIVALTKIDKPNANLDKARQSLAENEIYVEGWGGTIPCVPISAITGEGIDELFDMITLISEMSELTYDPTELASGTVIESTLDSRKGISATLLLKNGELQVGAVVLSGSAFAPARFIEDFRGTKIQTATASMPVRILGWNKMPECGLTFTTVSDKKTAEKLAAQYENEHKKNPKPNADTMKTKDQTPDADEKEDIVIIPIVVKADVIGSLEGIKHELQKIKNDKVKIKLVSDSIGDINENDIKLAQGDPNIILIAFNVSPDKKAQAMIERSPTPIQFQSFNIIYELSNFLRETMTSKIPKEYVEEVTGRAKILALFSKDKDRQIVGGKVESGVIELGNDVRILRREIEIGRGKIRELQSKKIKAREVAEGFEFGTMIDAKIEIAAGDRVEAVHTVEKINK